MSSLLVGVAPTDPITYGAIVVLFIAIAAPATPVPAWRATLWIRWPPCVRRDSGNGCRSAGSRSVPDHLLATADSLRFIAPTSTAGQRSDRENGISYRRTPVERRAPELD